MIVRNMARRTGLKPSSYGQLMKTDLEAGNLARRQLTTCDRCVLSQFLIDDPGNSRAQFTSLPCTKSPNLTKMLATSRQNGRSRADFIRQRLEFDALESR
jgi:hypothetical protein